MTYTATDKLKPIGIWLLTGYAMVFVMVVLGGITRLTQSGLSIVEWNVVMGTLPPLSSAEWSEAFRKYQEFPEFKILNAGMTMDEFQSIFWWEYVHRLWGRLIGLVFAIPFAVFLVRGQLSGSVMRQSLLAFVLGGLQGVMGWYMVQSGLIDVPHVSHFRLTVHLLLALTISGILLWTALTVLLPSTSVSRSPFLFWIRTVLVLVVVQIALGGLVAGLKAGYMYNTYPWMGDDFLPDSAWMLPNRLQNFVENGVMVQFLHRWLAVPVLVGVLVMWTRGRRLALTKWQRRILAVSFVLVVMQFTLGVLTLLYGVPVVLGVAHQGVAFILFSSLVCMLYMFKHPWEASSGR